MLGAVAVTAWVILWYSGAVYVGVQLAAQEQIAVPLAFILIAVLVALFGASLISEFFEGFGIYPMNGLLPLEMLKRWI